MKTAFICSGQGSQYVGMLKDIYEKYPQAAEKIQKANDILGFDISAIMFEGPQDELKLTKYTQPALFIHSAIIFDLIKEKINFDGVAGHSVGEYAALYAAGALSFEDALKLVAYRGKLMYEAGNELPGTMFAIIGMDDEKVSEICEALNKPSEGKIIAAANFNSPGQTVVSGSRDYLREITGEFKLSGAKMVKELVVSGAFHSPLMEPAKLELEKAINETKFNDTKVPIYSNVTAKALTKSEEIKEALIKQLTYPVKWTQSMKEMSNDGFDNFIELGPSNVLQGLVKRILSNVEISGFDKAEDIEKI